MTDNNQAADSTSGPNLPPARRHLRLAAIGGIAAVVILGGGITAVASAAAPEPTTSTSTVPVPPTATSAPSTGTNAPPTGTAKPSVPRTRTPHLSGTVTSVSGSTVLIKDRDGFTRTILVSTKTTYGDGLTAALPVGTEIHAEGKVDANGTSLDATAIGKRPAAQAGGPGGRGGRGHGGPPSGGGWGPGGPGQSTGTKPAPTTGAPAPSTSTAAPTTS